MSNRERQKGLVLAESSGRVLLLTLNRPEKLNALSKELVERLADCLADAERNDDIGTVVLTGAGRAFSAGADIADMLARGVASYADARRLKSWRVIECFPKPLIAAVNGFALGGGLELALLCDIILAAQTATFACPEINIGSFPGDGATQRLPRLVGRSFAMQMILTGAAIDATLAERKGLVSEVHSPDTLLLRAHELASEIATKSLPVLRLAKQAVRAAEEMHLAEGLRIEHGLTIQSFATDDRSEGLLAFAEKRPPRFSNR
jgi:enoyl-CoA hydratase/carnithine racemase